MILVFDTSIIHYDITRNIAIDEALNVLIRSFLFLHLVRFVRLIIELHVICMLPQHHSCCNYGQTRRNGMIGFNCY